MSYENPQIPEGINVSSVHPLKDFFILLIGLATFFVGLLLILYMAANYLSPWIPFSAEQKVAGYIASTWQGPGDQPSSQDHQLIERYLNEKAQLIRKVQGLPEEMTLQVHFIDDDVVNAFATLGGHIMMHRGLLQQLPHENALMMVLAHEIAHIKHRDPIQALGRGVMLAVVMGFVSGAVDSKTLSNAFSQAGLLTSLSFNRDQERAADREALASLKSLYGHSAGADALFMVLQEQMGGAEPPKWLSSHPLSSERIEAARDSSQNSGVELTEIPTDIKAALERLSGQSLQS